MILSFESTSLGHGNDRIVAEFELELAAGDCVAITAAQQVRAALADLAMGLCDPTTGLVGFLGVSWVSMPMRTRIRARRAIGCALDRPSWLSNLDVDENLTLGGRMDGIAPPECKAEVERVADRLGLGAIPRCRPHALDTSSGIAWSFVRALSLPRQLLILEDHGARLSTRTRDAVFTELAARRQDGCAVLWLSAEAPPAGLEASSSHVVSPTLAIT